MSAINAYDIQILIAGIYNIHDMIEKYLEHTTKVQNPSLHTKWNAFVKYVDTINNELLVNLLVPPGQSHPSPVHRLLHRISYATHNRANYTKFTSDRTQLVKVLIGVQWRITDMCTDMCVNIVCDRHVNSDTQTFPNASL